MNEFNKIIDERIRKGLRTHYTDSMEEAYIDGYREAVDYLLDKVSINGELLRSLIMRHEAYIV